MTQEICKLVYYCVISVCETKHNWWWRLSLLPMIHIILISMYHNADFLHKKCTSAISRSIIWVQKTSRCLLSMMGRLYKISAVIIWQPLVLHVDFPSASAVANVTKNTILECVLQQNLWLNIYIYNMFRIYEGMRTNSFMLAQSE